MKVIGKLVGAGITLGIALLLFLAIFFNTGSKPTPSSSRGQVLPASKTQTTVPSTCHIIEGLPDRTCTPGATDPRVIQENIGQTICVSGYTKTVRPPVSYTEPLKFKLMQKYGDTDSAKNYELDHLISLELGGDPESELNLWPEAYAPTPGAHEKDEVENYLHAEVCSGRMTLQEAQKEISTDWSAVYKHIVH